MHLIAKITIIKNEELKKLKKITEDTSTKIIFLILFNMMFTLKLTIQYNSF